MHLALTLVEDVIEAFIDDPLPALYEMNPADTTGLDVLYSGGRVDTTVGCNGASCFRVGVALIRRPKNCSQTLRSTLAGWCLVLQYSVGRELSIIYRKAARAESLGGVSTSRTGCVHSRGVVWSIRATFGKKTELFSQALSIYSERIMLGFPQPRTLYPMLLTLDFYAVDTRCTRCC